ncbi:sporulation-specific protein [Anaeramoeba ignava]|uniref:non-specific serine/threonine protein kinase n=1 Tax=Anaeramoeba ignava TaxID=1746090 RepID=A0A9Q0LAB9_ANAIG|nr:sporulation-specific protein [Anaeramoeba ignava]
MGDFQSYIEKYEQYEMVGKGAYGKVFRGKEKATEREVAIKVVELNECTQKQIMYLVSEVRNLALCHHQSLSNYIESFAHGSTVYIITEFMLTSLAELRKVVGIFDENSIAYIFYQILSGLSYIHRNDLIHRDIKPENIMISSGGDVRIADFGVVISNTECKNSEKDQFAGTPHYIAPEIAMGNKSYDYKVDIWSVGICAYEIVTGFVPHAKEDQYAVLDLIHKRDPPYLVGNSSGSLKKFVSSCLVKDPQKRPDADSLLGLKFFSKKKKKSFIEIIKKFQNLNLDQKNNLQNSLQNVSNENSPKKFQNEKDFWNF